MSENTQYLDLDSVVPETQVVIKLGGQEHPLQPITVEGFVANMKDVDAFTKMPNPTHEDEIDLTVGMLLRTFPTMKRDDLMKLSVLQLNKLHEFATENNGSKKVQQEAAADAGEDPQTAGS